MEICGNIVVLSLLSIVGELDDLVEWILFDERTGKVYEAEVDRLY